MPEALATTPRGFSIPEAAARLSISRTSLYRLIRAGSVQIVRLGGRTIVSASEIERLLIEGADTPPAA